MGTHEHRIPSRSSRGRFVAGGAASAAGFAIVRAPAKAAQFVFRCASQYPLDHPISVRLTQMLAAIEKETGGRLHIDYFPNSILGGDDSMFTQLRAGAIHVLIIGASFGTVVPAGDISNLGMAFTGEAEGMRVMDGPVGEWVREEAAAKNIHALRSMWLSGMLHVSSSSHPIRTPDDLRNFKIKVGGKISSDLFRHLGGTPVQLALSETYTAMQTKLVDGQSVPFVTLQASRGFEVQKYFSLTNHQFSGLWLIVNGDTWKTLPTDIQETIARNNTKYVAMQRRDELLLLASLGDKLTREGITINRVDQTPFRARLNTYYSDWSGNFGAKGWALLQSSLGRKLG